MHEDKPRHPHFTNCRVLHEGFDYNNAHKLKPTGDAHRHKLVAARPWRPRKSFLARFLPRRKESAA